MRCQNGRKIAHSTDCYWHLLRKPECPDQCFRGGGEEHEGEWETKGGGGVQPNRLKYLAGVLTVVHIIFYMCMGTWALLI